MRAHTLLGRLTATTIISGHFNSTAKKIRLKQSPNLVQYFKFMSTNLCVDVYDTAQGDRSAAEGQVPGAFTSVRRLFQ